MAREISDTVRHAERHQDCGGKFTLSALLLVLLAPEAQSGCVLFWGPFGYLNIAACLVL